MALISLVNKIHCILFEIQTFKGIARKTDELLKANVIPVHVAEPAVSNQLFISTGK